ncbi:MAG: hypothetical protein ACHQET_04640 [Chitinophagales bacterium]
MKIRSQDSQGWTASELGFGCMRISDFYRQGNDQEFTCAINRAIGFGISSQDTANI